MKKKIFISFLLILLCLTIAGCGKKITENNTTTTTKVTATNESTLDFDYTTDDNKIVFNFNDAYYMVFYFNGQTVTGMWYVFDFEDVETANASVAIYRSQYKNDENGFKRVYRRGTSVVIEFDGEQYKDLTRKQIEATFSYLKTMYGK
ncbi:MAG TPA: hypothetical protein PKY25_01645 [Bacilli bacterium]|nr:hypothetical protein [Bacilli bacterium]